MTETAKLTQPKGLYVLFLAEVWERFSYYGMRALLVLYLTAEIAERGMGWSIEHALSVYGTYTGLVYLTPMFGGILADKYLGQRIAVMIGGLLMVVGHFIMAITAEWALYTALALIILGNGFFKPNISTMVGQLYKENDPRRDGGFTIFYMGVNLGAFLAPLICGWLQTSYGWHYGFAAAGVGMIIGQLVFMYMGKKHLEGIGLRPKKHEGIEKKDTLYDKVQGRKVYITLLSIITTVLIATTIVDAFFVFSGQGTLFGSDGLMEFTFLISLTAFFIATVKRMVNFVKANLPELSSAEQNRIKIEGDRVNVIYILALFVIFFWAGFEQAGGYMNIYTEKFTDRMLFGFEIPTAWFQSLNPLFIISLASAFSALWLLLTKKGRNPSTPKKMSYGLIFLGLGFVFMMGSVVQQGGDETAKSSMIWIVMAYLFHTIGELCLSPIGLSMVTKMSPLKFGSFLMGIWFLSNALSNKLAGLIGGFVSELGPMTLFVGIAVSVSIAGLILIGLSKKLTSMMHGVD